MAGLLFTLDPLRARSSRAPAATAGSRSPGPRSARSGCCCSRSSTATTSTALAALYMLIFGMGLGMVMQVLVLAVQNSVDYEMLGVATSGATLFRSIGGSLGTALLGAVFTNKLSHELAANLPRRPARRRRRREPRPVGRRAAAGGRARRLPHVVHGLASTSCSSSRPGSWRSRSCSPGSSPSARCATPCGRPGCSRRSPRRRTPTPCARSRASSASSSDARASSTSSSAPRPGPTSTSRRRAAGCWPARRATGRSTCQQLAAAHDVDLERLRAACRDLHARELLTDGPDHTTGLTPAGARAVDALADARCAALEDLVADWSPAEHPELHRYVEQLSDDLVAQAPRN